MRSVWAGLPVGEGWVEEAETKQAENRGRERVIYDGQNVGWCGKIRE